MKLKYYTCNILLLIGSVPALFFGLIGVDIVLEIKTIYGYFGMIFITGYLLICILTTVVSIKHYFGS